MGSSYGQVDISSPYDGAHGNIASKISYDDFYITPTSVEVPLGSSHAQVFLILLMCMDFPCIKSEPIMLLYSFTYLLFLPEFPKLCTHYS